MTMLLLENGRDVLQKRLDQFLSETSEHPILAKIFTDRWFNRCRDAIRSLPLLQTLDSFAPEALPFNDYCDSPLVFTRTIAERLEQLSELPGFSVKRYRQKFMSDGADVHAILFEINFLGRFKDLENLEPIIGDSTSRAEAVLKSGNRRIYLECFCLYYPEMLADLSTDPNVLASRFASKILVKAEQLKNATIPAIVAIALSHQHMMYLNSPQSPLLLGGDMALSDPASAPIKGLVVEITDQIKSSGHFWVRTVGRRNSAANLSWS
ncbi:MAG: hypothetical protein O2999_14555 [Nitrospirae bacterium]|nr:hypothetical protein [Nitrospirota bacterium]